MYTPSSRDIDDISSRVLQMFKLASSKPVTISKNGRSYVMPSMEACAKYFARISSFSAEQIKQMIDNREKYICGFYIEYTD